MRHFRAGEGMVAALSFTPDGGSLVCVEADDGRRWPLHRAVHWIDPRTGERGRILDLRKNGMVPPRFTPEEELPWGEAFVSPDGQWVAVLSHWGDYQDFNLWDAKTGRWQAVRSETVYDFVEGVCFSARSDLLLFAIGTGEFETFALERLDLKTGGRLPILPFHFPTLTSVRQLQISADERLLAALTYKGVVVGPHDRERADPEVSVELELNLYRPVARFSPSGDELALVNGPQLFFWDCKSPDAVKWTFDGKGVNDLAYSPDGRLLALGFDDGTVVLHDRQKKREVARYDWKIGRVVSLAFAADGMTAAVGGEGGRVVLWDVDV